MILRMNAKKQRKVYKAFSQAQVNEMQEPCGLNYTP